MTSAQFSTKKRFSTLWETFLRINRDGNEILWRCENGVENAQGDGPAMPIAASFSLRNGRRDAFISHFQLQKGNARKPAKVPANIVSGSCSCARHAGKTNTSSHCIAFAYSVTPLRTFCFKVYAPTVKNMFTLFDIPCFIFIFLNADKRTRFAFVENELR